jgi:hypothetical protein
MRVILRIQSVLVAITTVFLAPGAQAQATGDCAGIRAALTAIDGYQVTIPPSGPDQGWCVLDGASFRSQTPGWPDLEVAQLRLRQSPTEVELDLSGLTAAPRPFDRESDERLRSLMRLRSADLRLRVEHDPEAGVLSLSGLRLALSGGTVVELDADMKGASLSPSSLVLGAVTAANLVWRSDGKLARPLMDMAGEPLAGRPGPDAVEAARAELAEFVDGLPDGTIDDASGKALAAAVAALPQGRGKLTLSFVSPAGIGSARLAGVALSGELLSPKALGTILDGATISADWQPGLVP